MHGVAPYLRLHTHSRAALCSLLQRNESGSDQPANDMTADHVAVMPPRVEALVTDENLADGLPATPIIASGATVWLDSVPKAMFLA